MLYGGLVPRSSLTIPIVYMDTYMYMYCYCYLPDK